MINQNKHIKNLKIYNKQHNSFLLLKNNNFFSIFTGKVVLTDTVIELLTNLVKSFNPHDNYTKDEYKDFVEEEASLASVYRDEEIPDYLLEQIIDISYAIYLNNDFFDFRGEVLEYLIVKLTKTASFNKIYHEPVFYHKRNPLIRKNFKGKNCLIDVVMVQKKSYNVKLIECKANLDNQIRKKKFHNKLDYMDQLKKVLSKYINYKNEKIQAEKIIATINEPKKNLPNNYIDYKIINLFDYFKLQESID